MTANVKESFPLSWPSGWPRTRPQDQKPMGSWKRTANQYREALMTELERMGAPSFVISCNVAVSHRGTMAPGIEPRDVGVAVYFSRKLKEDFSWQDALNITDPYPTEEMVQDAYRKLAVLYHPDKIGGDKDLFHAATQHRDNALRWIRQKSTQNFDYVIACDQFREVRLNLEAIALTIRSIRQIERCGTSSLLERAFKGFSALPEYSGPQTASGVTL